MADSMTDLLQEVRSQRERLETVINSVDDGIVVLDPERNVIAANEAFLQRTGRERHAILGSSCRHAAPGLCAPSDCPTLACLHSGERQVRICERRTLAGKSAWEEIHSSPIRDAAGRITQVVEVWRDISDRRTAEAQLAESHRLASLGMLASGFSHELNTPLATVLTCVEGILRESQEEEKSRPVDQARIGDHARIAREQLLRCRGITQHFLRLSSGKGSPTDLVDLAQVLGAVTRLIEPTARSLSVAVTLEPVEPGTLVRVNEAELQQVLLNLILNGIQAMPARGGAWSSAPAPATRSSSGSPTRGAASRRRTGRGSSNRSSACGRAAPGWASSSP